MALASGKIEFSPVQKTIHKALYQLLKQKGFSKTAKKLKKEVKYDLKLIPTPDWSFIKLFDRIEQELNGATEISTSTPIDSSRKRSDNSTCDSSPAKRLKPEDIGIPTKGKAVPMTRIDNEAWSNKCLVKDNSWAANNGDEYASQAAASLDKVRGKNFTKEKNKKKRASWKGAGALGGRVNSVFFTDSD